MSSVPFNELWIQLSASPVYGLGVTLLAYLAGIRLFKRSGQHPLANPVLIAILLIILLLWVTRTPYPRYFDSAQFIHFLLGPVTVALAVPLYTYWRRLWQMALPLIVALFAGSATAVFSAMGLAWFFGASPETIFSLAPDP